MKAFQRDGKATLCGEEVTTEDVEVVWLFAGDPAAVESVSNGDAIVILDIVEDDALVEEGWARDVTRNIQRMRKEAGLALTDRVECFFELLAAKPAAAGPTDSAPTMPAKEKEEKKTAKGDAKTKEKGAKKDKAAAAPAAAATVAPAAAAPLAAKKAATTTLANALRSQAKLITETLCCPLLPVSFRPPHAAALRSDVVDIDGQALALHLTQQSVAFDNAALQALARQHALPESWPASVCLYLGTKEYSLLRRRVESSPTPHSLSVLIDGKRATLEVGKHMFWSPNELAKLTPQTE